MAASERRVSLSMETLATTLTNVSKVAILKSVEENPKFFPNLIQSVKKELTSENEIASRPIVTSYATSAIVSGELSEYSETPLSSLIKLGSMTPTIGIVTTELQIMGKVDSPTDAIRDPKISFLTNFFSLEDEALLLEDRTGISLIEKYIERINMKPKTGIVRLGFIQGAQLARDIYKMAYPLTENISR